jgi:hypothetical protein
MAKYFSNSIEDVGGKTEVKKKKPELPKITTVPPQEPKNPGKPPNYEPVAPTTPTDVPEVEGAITPAVTNPYAAGAYTPSETVLAAENLLAQHLNNKPGAYQSAWQTQLDDTINKILNREKFSYDLNGDALYQQYKDKYIQQGQMAMMDTMGQAAAMTGGYGNSYAQSVGQQAYQGQLQNLNNIIPELYQMAMDQYNNEGQNLLNQYSMLGAQEEQDYGRYRDQMGDYNTELARLTEDARYQGEQDYGRWADDRAYSQWEAEFNEAKRQYDQQYEASTSKSSDSSSDSNNTGGGGFDNGEYSEDIVRKAQVFVGATVDGKWGNESASKAKENNFNSLAEVVAAMGGGGGSELDQSKIKAFESNLHPESQHDAIARATYGPYSAYVARVLSQNTDLSDAEVDYLISKYHITGDDYEYLKSKGLAD